VVHKIAWVAGPGVGYLLRVPTMAGLELPVGMEPHHDGGLGRDSEWGVACQ
jgi:hypothetical protein